MLHPLAHSTCRKRLAGFTLVELTLAIGIFSFGLVALMGTMPVGIISMQESMHRTVASNILRGVAAEVRQADFSTLSNATIRGGTGNADDAWHDTEGFPSDDEPDRQIFKVQVDITDPGSVSEPTAEALILPTGAGGPGPANAKVKKVQVAVLHQPGGGGAGQQIGRATFYVGDNGR